VRTGDDGRLRDGQLEGLRNGRQDAVRGGQRDRRDNGGRRRAAQSCGAVAVVVEDEAGRERDIGRDRSRRETLGADGERVRLIHIEYDGGRRREAGRLIDGQREVLRRREWPGIAGDDANRVNAAGARGGNAL